jgi:hypothetical protein
MVTAIHHLAQFNIARALAPLDDPLMADFVAQLDAVNAGAESSQGFVWRLKGADGAPSSYVRAYSDANMLVNLTVWESPEALHSYTYRSGHADVFRRRKTWFEASEQSPFVLWWIRAGHIPSVEEGRERIEYLWQHGPSPFAFTFRQQFPPTE